MGYEKARTPDRDPGPFPAGRTCTERGCSTLLSQANPSERCWPHGGWRTPVGTADRSCLEDLADLLTEAP